MTDHLQRDLLGGCPDDTDLIKHGVLQHLIPLKGMTIETAGVSHDLSDGIHDVLQIKPRMARAV